MFLVVIAIRLIGNRMNTPDRVEAERVGESWGFDCLTGSETGGKGASGWVSAPGQGRKAQTKPCLRASGIRGTGLRDWEDEFGWTGPMWRNQERHGPSESHLGPASASLSIHFHLQLQSQQPSSPTPHASYARPLGPTCSPPRPTRRSARAIQVQSIRFPSTSCAPERTEIQPASKDWLSHLSSA